MQTENVILIKGDLNQIYELAAKVENWHHLLPHYRDVKVLESGEKNRIVRMQCVRDFGLFRFPCRWRASQTLERESNKIIFKHVGGITKGMYVEWNLVPQPEGIRVTISHELKYKIPVLGKLLSDQIIGPYFVKPIADRTLKTIKTIIESEAKQ